MMSPQERALLQEFLTQLVEIRGVEKDREAEQLIQRAVAAQPDAAYLLTQRALLLQQALDSAKAEIARLQQTSAGNAGSFLAGGNAWGHEATASRPASSVSGRPISPSQEAPVPPQQQQPVTRSPFGGSFLGQAAATAAGVAGGAFLFQGLEHLLGGHDWNAPSQHLAQADRFTADPAQDDTAPADAQDITSDIDWNDFDDGGSDDSSSI